ncbi:hypothetical protein GALMADRAFT_253039 [Galerina marginata CBS 339.88]|uniref:Uncharacterized protein n=1 Tax=Galerina marginata (strain CBS 339.88) TaxID=685588 RepID=A0A067SMP0_GALM3|nr:hypothetical protein GALMADRAFT_253039 [Galerina marginata CBS 339.88]
MSKRTAGNSSPFSSRTRTRIRTPTYNLTIFGNVSLCDHSTHVETTNSHNVREAHHDNSQYSQVILPAVPPVDPSQVPRAPPTVLDEMVGLTDSQNTNTKNCGSHTSKASSSSQTVMSCHLDAQVQTDPCHDFDSHSNVPPSQSNNSLNMVQLDQDGTRKAVGSWVNDCNEKETIKAAIMD